MKYLGFDFGTKRIGVAVGQDITHQATPLTILSATEGQPKWPEVDALIAAWNPAGLIIGMPYNTGYSDDITYQRAKIFGNALKNRYSLEIHEVDEHLSSVEAKYRLKQKGENKKILEKAIDSEAACVLLESWLHSQK